MNGNEITKWRESKKLKKKYLAGEMKVSVRTLIRAEQSDLVSKAVQEKFESYRTLSGLRAAQAEITYILNELEPPRKDDDK